jgi:hypothetical protein
MQNTSGPSIIYLFIYLFMAHHDSWEIYLILYPTNLQIPLSLCNKFLVFVFLQEFITQHESKRWKENGRNIN